MKWIFIVLSAGLLFACASSPAPEGESSVPPQSSVPAQTPGTPDSSAEKNRALEAMNKARSVKAEVAVKAAFNEAMERYNRAESLAASGSAAGDTYLESEKLFLAAYEDARLKREEAERSLTLARDAVKQAEENAAALDGEQGEDSL
jgi:hypothetical protein